jgi:hypothetical protein
MNSSQNTFSDDLTEYHNELMSFLRNDWVSKINYHANVLFKHFLCMQKLEEVKIKILNTFQAKDKLADAWKYFGGYWSPENYDILYNSNRYHYYYINSTLDHFLKEDLENEYLFGTFALDGLKDNHGHFDSLWTNFFTGKEEKEFYSSFFTLTESQKDIIDFHKLCTESSPEKMSEILNEELSKIILKQIRKELDFYSDLNPIYREYEKHFIRFVYLSISLQHSKIALETALFKAFLTKEIKNFNPRYESINEIFHYRDLNPYWSSNDPFGDNYCNYQDIILSRFDHIIKELEVKNDSKSIIELKYIQLNTKLDAVFKYY